MKLDAETTALVLIDLQRGVLAMPVAPHPAAAVYERAMQLAQRCRASGAPVVRVRVSFSADMADALRSPVDQPTNYAALPPGWDEFPEPPHASDLIIAKHHWGAFYGSGISTNIGVESTARSAAEHGYELVVAEDLCSASSAEMHAFSFKHILPRLARITTSEAITLG